MNGQQQFYGDGYEPSYTPLVAIPVSDRPNDDWTENQYESEAQSQTIPKRLSYSDNDTPDSINGDASQLESDDDFNQTSFQNELLEPMQIKREDTDTFDSQIPPNQEFISQLDGLFDDSPQQAYIESVLSYLKGKEGLLTWYRNILISRLRGINDSELFQKRPCYKEEYK